MKTSAEAFYDNHGGFVIDDRFDAFRFAEAYCEKELSELLKQNKELMEAWISVKDRLPELETPSRQLSVDVLGYIEGNAMVVTYYNHFKKEWILENNRDVITHWMPLPEPPKP